MKAALRDRDYLQHILEAIGKIQRFVAGKSEADFFADDMAQDAVIRNLEIIGEAVTKLSPQFKTAHSDGYVSVNMQIVWDTVVAVLPAFSERVQTIVREMASR